MEETFGWLDVELIAELLAQRHPDLDPAGVRFTDLKRLVEALPGFKEEPGHPCNERILETIQALWIAERSDDDAFDEED